MVRAFFTFDGSMGLTAAGTGIGLAGVGTVLGADIINRILQSSKVKDAQKALEENEKVAQEFSLEIEKLQKLAKKVKRDVYFKRGKLVYHIRHNVKKIASISSTIASSSDEAVSTVLPLLGKRTLKLYLPPKLVWRLYRLLLMYTQSSTHLSRCTRVQLLKLYKIFVMQRRNLKIQFVILMIQALTCILFVNF